MRLITVLLLIAVAGSVAQGREWSDTTGKFHVQAKLKNVADASVVLVTDDGRELTVPLEKLTPADRQYANAWLARGEGKPPKLPPNAVVVADHRIIAADGTGYKSDNTRVAVVRWPKVSQPIVLSCTDPFAHKSLGINLDDLQKFSAKFEVLTASDRKSLGKSTGVVPIKGVQFPGRTEAVPDGIVAFYLDAKSKAGALTLADNSPEPKENIWAMTVSEHGSKGDNPLLPATVDKVLDNMMTVKYQENVVAEPYLGVMFVNFAGEIVGMQAGHLGRNTGMVMRVEHMREKLKTALAK